ncbi:MAG: Rrf2 family transcriptional regulator [Acidobacteriia bacterium]|nr:Rrf2 family transcriptional regulator [Terriglobia bacterium]
MIHIASTADGVVSLRSDIAEAQGIPPSFMAKILRSLVRARLLRSSRGVHGGFALARAASRITLLDVVEAIEGPLSLTNCTPDPAGCARSDDCPATSVWLEVQQKMAEVLNSTTLESLTLVHKRTARPAVAHGSDGDRRSHGRDHSGKALGDLASHRR